MFKDKRYQEISSIIIFFFSIILFLSLISYNSLDYSQPVHKTENIIGPFGAWISNLLRTAFGYSSFMITALLILIGCELLHDEKRINIFEKIYSFTFLIITTSALVTVLWSAEYQFSGGFMGYYIFKYLRISTGKTGAILIIAILNLLSLILTGILSFKKLIKNKNVNKEMIQKIKYKLNNFLLKNKWEPVVPFNFVKEELFRTDTKIPWIIKKKVSFINKTENFNKTQLIKYLEMPVIDPQVIVEEKEVINPIENNDLFNYEFKSDIAEPDRTNDLTELDEIEINDNIRFEEKLLNQFEETEIKDNNTITVEDEIETIIEPVHEIRNDEQKEKIEFNRIKNINIDKKENTNSPETENSNFNDNKIENISINNEYIIPHDFLKSTVPADSESWNKEINKNSTLLVNTLADFGIEAKVINVNRGPVITLYEVQIASGIKVNKIVALSDDIAMALAALRVRIVAPIPGKSAIGVEIPNQIRENVTLGDIIKSKEYKNSNHILKVALGKDILGNPVTIDLKKMPHLLIAGATGSGKSVCVNSIISSLIYNYDPGYLRFILIDPKMVELQMYNGCPHLLTPVITESHSAQVALKWTIYEMDNRYRILSEHNCRDIQRFNEKIEFENSNTEKMPYIVTIIDELADLMMVASKEIEGYITRIAQKARAVGIHLVLATQRPSVDVITGIIKANFPARIAFQVAQKNDSRTILDQNGAEKLLGKGDMLYQSPVSSFPVRIQGSFISEDEIISIVKHLSSISKPNYIDIEECVEEINEKMGKDESGDELMVEALKIVEETRKASASYLQRRLSIGYNRAARIIEHMEDLGYIGPQQGSKPREVFI